MSRFGHELSWLEDPSQIPADAAGSSESLSAQCDDLTAWMVGRIAQWSSAGHGRLSLRETFEKYDLSNEERVDLRARFQKNPARAYTPGMAAMAEIFALVPPVAAREGIGREEWGEIGARAQGLGEKLSHDGTEVQRLIREYLAKEAIVRPAASGLENTTHTLTLVLDPGKMKLDPETGITTVTPIDELVKSADELVERYFVRQSPGTCVALQAASPEPACRHMFDAVWTAYGSAVDKLIYARLGQDGLEIPPAQSPDENAGTAMHSILMGRLATRETQSYMILE
ncbi:MAG TPA: hypothetical protein VD706_03360 [Candidatus Saccharimonadales bacterium]|nr:hypothetical protein [Candidatus Saccharimonadales bacterium]